MELDAVSQPKAATGELHAVSQSELVDIEGGRWTSEGFCGSFLSGLGSIGGVIGDAVLSVARALRCGC